MSLSASLSAKTGMFMPSFSKIIGKGTNPAVNSSQKLELDGLKAGGSEAAERTFDD